MEGDAVEDTVDCISRDEEIQLLNENRKSPDLQKYH